VKDKVPSKKVKGEKPKKDGQLLGDLHGMNEYVALATIDSKKYHKTNINIIKELIKGNVPGVYVTLNKPYQNVKTNFEKANVPTNNVIFIDAVTKTVGGIIEKKKDCLYIGSPKNLSDISIAMDQAIMAIPKRDKFLFFDSLSTLLLYNSVDVVAKFVHFLSGKMRVWKVRGIIISLRREKDKELISGLREFCDVQLDL
jgi:archaellum biogenesis ATPase FlaH